MYDILGAVRDSKMPVWCRGVKYTYDMNFVFSLVYRLYEEVCPLGS